MPVMPKKLKQNGNIIVIATGSILKSALIATDEGEFANYIVTDAGAAVYKRENEKWEDIYVDLIPNYSESIITKNYKNKNEILKNIKDTIHISVVFLDNKFVEEYRKIFIK